MLKKILMLGFLFVLFMGVAVPAMATFVGNVTFDTTSSGVNFSVYDGGYYVRSSQIPTALSSPGLYASSSISGTNFQLSASGTGYSDAGIVLYFNGGLTLGALQGVLITSTGSPLAMNLWLDTGGDGKFFAFDSSGLLTGLNGDSYGGHEGNLHNLTSSFYMLGGNGAGNTYTLAQLQAGAVTGIDANTPTALWIGITNAGGSSLSANISKVELATTVPIPGAVWLLGSGLVGLVGIRRRFKK